MSCGSVWRIRAWFWLCTTSCTRYARYPGGMVADRWGARPTMVLALVACSVTTALNGLVHGYAALLAVRALFAVSIAAIPGVTMKMLVERVRNFFQPQAEPDGPGVFVHLRRTGHDNLSPLGPT